MKNAPCMNCQKRVLGCQVVGDDGCFEYTEYRKEIDAMNNKVRMSHLCTNAQKSKLTSRPKNRREYSSCFGIWA